MFSDNPGLQLDVALIRWGTLLTLFKLSKLQFSYLQYNDNIGTYKAFIRIKLDHVYESHFANYNVLQDNNNNWYELVPVEGYKALILILFLLTLKI